MNKKWFTLLEVILVIVGFFLLMGLVIWVYKNMVKLKYNVDAKQTLIQNSYYMFEKINLELKDYTIDYEEYYNRKNVWCDSNAESRDVWVNWSCDKFTGYGNQNSIIAESNTGNHTFYYCSSLDGYSSPELVINESLLASQWSGCYDSDEFYPIRTQSFGQYGFQYWDMKNDVDYIVGVVNDDDDDDLWMGPSAIMDPANVQELYLISQDNTKRFFIRRQLLASGDRNGTWWVSGDTEYWYNLQMLKLKWFDAGDDHNFDGDPEWLYDGQIDTWACDYSQWFICNGPSVGGSYTWYRLPADVDDGWVDMFEKNITLSDRNISISPNKSPESAWNEYLMQLNPYITVSMTTKLYGEVWQRRYSFGDLDDFQLTLQTTFNTKNFYTK